VIWEAYISVAVSAAHWQLIHMVAPASIFSGGGSFTEPQWFYSRLFLLFFYSYIFIYLFPLGRTSYAQHGLTRLDSLRT